MPPLPRWKLWSFRLTALLGLPLLFAIITELSLRIAGVGEPSTFLLAAQSNHQSVWIPNPRFGWRYFGRNMAREPLAFSIPQNKPANTIRIFVFGESAAYGDPQPAFGLPRMLRTMLQLRYPQTQFEIVNAAMTGINSHVIRDIANDCAKADADLWVVYMGNNEVVGPFGAGTVFSKQTPSLAFIRSTLMIKSTRIGQLLDTMIERMQSTPASKSEWGGMLMFLDQAVPASDPRMTRVYRHFENNLSDIIAASQRAGAPIVVSTVAVNLKDCAPFASEHKSGLIESDKKRWQDVYVRAVRAQDAGNFRGALSLYSEAAQLDDSVAELHFRQAECLLAEGNAEAAQQKFRLARNLDTLRFRCDTRLNDIIREQVRQTNSRLADTEKIFAESSTNGVPGRELFYEHVHLTWEGNWLLAHTIAEQVASLLPATVTNHDTGFWPGSDTCARSLAWTDRDRRDALAMMLGRLQDPPFTHQLSHDQQFNKLTSQMNGLSTAVSAAGLKFARETTEAAVSQSLDDPILQSQLAEIRQLTGDMNGSIAAAKRVTELLPHSQIGWSQLGLLLMQAQRDGEAVTALANALRLDPDNVWTLYYLAELHSRNGRVHDALNAFHRILKLKPRFGMAHLGIGQILEARGQRDEAEVHYRLAVQNRIYRADELTRLGRFCLAKGWIAAAHTNLLDALKLNPNSPALHRDLAETLAKLGRHTEAEQQRALAGTDPTQMQLHYRRGLELGRAGKPAEAAAEFREVVRLMPELAEGHLNLGLALKNQGLNQEALEQFREALRLRPTNQLAAEHIRLLTESPEASQDISSRPQLRSK